MSGGVVGMSVMAGFAAVMCRLVTWVLVAMLVGFLLGVEGAIWGGTMD